MNKKSVVILMLILIAIIVFLFAMLMYNLKTVRRIGNNMQNVNNVHNSQNVQVVQTNSEEIKISPNAIITFLKHYSNCGHVVRVKENAPKNIVNISKDAFSSLYSDWKINKFTSTEIELSKDFSGDCNEHFLVKSNPDGFIEIYKVQPDTSLVLHEKTDISVKYLSNEDIAELENGVYLYGKENLNAYIENFE